MPSKRVPKENNRGIYFVTFTVKDWIFIFDRHNRWDILRKSLLYCIQQKGLSIYSYVFMINHIHLIIYSPDVSGFIRDFKRFTSREVHRNLIKYEPSKISLLNNKENVYQFWQRTNMPLMIESEKFLLQKARYIENNPVRKRYVERPEFWWWSSANPHSQIPIVSW